MTTTTNAAVKNTADRNNAEMVLRDIAYVLQLTKRVKQSILDEQPSPKANGQGERSTLPAGHGLAV